MRHHVRLRLIARARATGQTVAVTLSPADEAFIATLDQPIQTDAAIGRLCDCSRENVRQVRVGLGLPPAATAARSAPSLDRLLATPDLRALLGVIPDTEIAEKAQVGVSTVALARAVVQKEAAPRHSPLRPYVHLLGVSTDAEIARLAGTSHVAVVRYRSRLGIPSRRAIAQHEAEESKV